MYTVRPLIIPEIGRLGVPQMNKFHFVLSNFSYNIETIRL
jgi:hypothetical protein